MEIDFTALAFLVPLTAALTQAAKALVKTAATRNKVAVFISVGFGLALYGAWSLVAGSDLGMGPQIGQVAIQGTATGLAAAGLYTIGKNAVIAVKGD